MLADENRLDQLPYKIFTSYLAIQCHNPVTSMALSRGVPKKIEYRDSDSILVRKEEFTYYRNLVYKAWLPYRNEIGPFIRIASPRLYYYLPYMSEHTVSDYAASGDGSHYDYTESAYYNEHRLPHTPLHKMPLRTATA